jgi:hypothetical protein
MIRRAVEPWRKTLLLPRCAGQSIEKKRHIADTNWRDCARKIGTRFSVEQSSQEFTYRRHSKKKRKRTRKQNEKEKKMAAGFASTRSGTF